MLFKKWTGTKIPVAVSWDHLSAPGSSPDLYASAEALRWEPDFALSTNSVPESLLFGSVKKNTEFQILKEPTTTELSLRQSEFSV